jgi:hypothetical protein
MEDQEVTYLRFLTDADDWITVDMHSMVPTKTKPSWWPEGSKWPDKMGSVCRNDKAFAQMYDGCFICDYIVDGKKVRNASGRSWALACIREEVIEDGKRVGFRDGTRERTIPAREAKDGKDARPAETITEKNVVVVNQGYKNFFSILSGYAGRNGTILDRDFYIKREGSDQSTVYHIIAEDPYSIEVEGEVVQFDLRDERFKDRYPHDIDLAEIVMSQADDEYYAKFFDTRITVSDDGKVETTGEAPPPPPDADISKERLSALADRVKSMGATTPPAAEAQETPAAEAPTTEAPAEEPAEKVASGPPAVARDFG